MEVKKGFLVMIASVAVGLTIFTRIWSTAWEEVAQPVMRQAEQLSYYLLALRYSGQQGSGVNAIVSIQCWASHTNLPIKLVEPAILTSIFEFSLDPTTMVFGDYFDMEHFNKAARTAGYLEMISRNEFLQANSKKVIILNLTRQGDKGTMWIGNSSHLCYSGNLYSEFTERSYCILEITHTNLTSLTSTLKSSLKKWNSPGVSVVLTQWMAPYCPLPQCKGRYRSTKHQFIPSARLVSNAQQYTEHYLGSSTSYNAVMLRLEHTVIQEEHNQGKLSTKKCIDRVSGVVVSQLQKKQDSEIPVITADMGKYGSNSYSWTVKFKRKLAEGRKYAMTAMERLLKGRMTFQEWENSFVESAGGVTNKGYIAALQRTIASRARCLVLMGGGNFQDLAVQEYARLHSNTTERCVHFVCVRNQELLKSRLQLS